ETYLQPSPRRARNNGRRLQSADPTQPVGGYEEEPQPRCPCPAAATVASELVRLLTVAEYGGGVVLLPADQPATHQTFFPSFFWPAAGGGVRPRRVFAPATRAWILPRWGVTRNPQQRGSLHALSPPPPLLRLRLLSP